MKKSPRGYYIKHYKKARHIMNYSKLFKDFKNELFQAIQYKRLTTGYRIMAAIATFPFWAMYCTLLCVKYVYLFMYNCLASSNDYLEIWVKETKQGVQHATEAVIYLVAMPFIFFIRCILSFFSIIFYMLWFSAMIAGYICSLGGIKWQPFISQAKYDDNVTYKATTDINVANKTIIATFVAFVGYIAMFILSAIVDDWDVIETLYTIGSILSVAYSILTCVVIPVNFKKVAVATDAPVAVNASADVKFADSSADSDFEEEFPDF